MILKLSYTRGDLKMKHEIFSCDICHSDFESIEAVRYRVIVSDDTDVLSFHEVCFSCVGTVKSALQRCGLKNVDKLLVENKTF